MQRAERAPLLLLRSHAATPMRPHPSNDPGPPLLSVRSAPGKIAQGRPPMMPNWDKDLAAGQAILEHYGEGRGGMGSTALRQGSWARACALLHPALSSAGRRGLAQSAGADGRARRPMGHAYMASPFASCTLPSLPKTAGLEVFDAPLALEGGSIHSDGEG